MLTKALKNLSTNRSLRRIILPMLKRFNPGDIHIRHHYTGARLRLHSFRHKGYWFHGRSREEATMQFFRAALRPGESAIEIGGHIGYISMWLAELVGKDGRVIVFEPGQNNLPYLRANVAGVPAIEVLPLAISDFDGTAPFFEEELTGQNNSLHADYDMFDVNRRMAFSDAQYRRREARVARLDTIVAERSLKPSLIKIDIEGAESLALAGAMETLAAHKPVVMVEVTRSADEVWLILTELGYALFTPEGRHLTAAGSLNGNVCAVHPVQHEHILSTWLPSTENAAA